MRIYTCVLVLIDFSENMLTKCKTSYNTYMYLTQFMTEILNFIAVLFNLHIAICSYLELSIVICKNSKFASFTQVTECLRLKSNKTIHQQ